MKDFVFFLLDITFYAGWLMHKKNVLACKVISPESLEPCLNKNNTNAISICKKEEEKKPFF